MKKDIFDHPSTYHIVIAGFLDAEWSDRLGGMTITNTKNAAGADETALDGSLTDQPALLGVLNTVYDMGYSLLLVERVC
jgi:hypothetical protein